jgi:hypothetical protein
MRLALSLSFPRLVTWLCALLILSACAPLLGPRSVQLSKTDLEQKLARVFPLQRKLLEVFSVTVDKPQVDFLPQLHRVATTLNVSLQDRLQGREYHGNLRASFGLRYDAQATALRLSEVRIESLQIEGLSRNAQDAVTRLGSLLAQDKLEGMELYRVKAEDAARADRLGYIVGSVEITADAVVLHLVAKPN